MKHILIIFLLTAITLSNLGGEYIYSPGEKEAMVGEYLRQSRAEYIRSQDFSPQLMVEYMELIGLCHADVVYRQAVLETGWFTHPRCTVYNNYFGMRRARVRKHCQAGVWKGHATYEHWTLSVDDYKLWQEYWEGEDMDMTDYYAFLREVGYATARNYTRTLRKINNLTT